MAERRTNRVVILGAGFGGLQAAMELARALGRERARQVTLVDRQNFHLFTPMLYQVATGLVEPGHIAYPLRLVARRYGFEFRQARVRELDLERRCLATDERALGFDHLVLAPGSATNFFDMDEARRHCLTLKTLGDGIRLRNALVDAFERAEAATDPQERRRWLTFVVVGGGATGVELMSSLATLMHEAMLPGYPRVGREEARLVLIEALPRLLAGLHSSLADRAAHRLRTLGVEVRLGTAVTAVTGEGVSTTGGEFIPARTVVWAAGVRASPLAAQVPAERGKGGRIVVDECLRVPGLPGLYAIGDVALFHDPRAGQPLPPTAAVAVRQGRHLGRTLAEVLDGGSARPFRYRHLGELVALGRNCAVAEIKGVRFDGFLAWAVWRAFYLSQLMGFKNRLAVLLDWFNAYFRYRDIARLDLAPEWQLETEAEARRVERRIA